MSAEDRCGVDGADETLKTAANRATNSVPSCLQHPRGTGTSSSRSVPSTGTGSHTPIRATRRPTTMTLADARGWPPRKMAYLKTAACTVPGHPSGAMSCKSSLYLRCAKVYVDHWVSQVSKVLHEA